MKKVVLDILGLSYSQTQSGAYALILGEQDGKRRLPVIIGGFEAQSISIGIEGLTNSRPLTHDLFKSLAELYHIQLKEVLIYNLVEGIFHAKLIIQETNGEELELDARTSDAIALAVRFKCPVYTYEFILATAGILLDDPSEDEESDELKTEFSNLTTEELGKLLQVALDDEDYERAAQIKAELDTRD